MTKPRKLPSGLWFVQVECRGRRPSRAFATKTAADVWAADTRKSILDGSYGQIPNLTIADLLTKYEKEVSATKKGKRWEEVRLAMLRRDKLARVTLRGLDKPDASAWQQRRLKEVSASTVRRERNLLNHVFQIAFKEWKWLSANPFEGIRRPKEGKPRDRLATPEEIESLTASATESMRRVIIWALETGMRAGEIASLTKIYGAVAYLADSKNGESREVPLSTRALAVWRDGGFGLTAGSISALFARLCKDTGIVGLTFHDLRHNAITALSKKLDPFQLAKMVGHKDLKMALRVYYKADMQEISKRLG